MRAKRPQGEDDAAPKITAPELLDKKSQLLYVTAIESAGIGTWDLDLSNDVVCMSPCLAQMLGFSPEVSRLSAEKWKATVLSEDLHLLDQALQEASLSGGSVEVHFRMHHQSGHQIWVSSRGKVIRDANGNPLHATGAMIDITAEKEAQAALRESEERYRQLAELSPDGIIVSVEDAVVYANQAASRILGFTSPLNILRKTVPDLLDACSYNAVTQWHEKILLNAGPLSPIILSLKRTDGSFIPVQATGGAVTWLGKPAIQVLMRDFTELKQTQDKLFIMSERLQLAIEGAGEGIWDWDIPSNSYTFSGGLKKILGYGPVGAVHEPVDWPKLIHTDDLPNVYDAVRSCLNGDTPTYRCEYRIRAKDGSWKWVLSRGVIVDRDENAKPVAMTGTMTDITARKDSEDEAWRHANLDALTGVPNRRFFRDRLNHELNRFERTNQKTALLFIDLDRFKEVNDVFGHDAGDLLLKDAVQRIRSCVRETDTIARLGGDEFIVMMNELASLHPIEFTCQRILNALAEPFQVRNEIVYVSASIGIALFPLDASEPDDLIRKADQAMYAAKKNGKNQFCYFTQSMDQQAHFRLRISSELRKALQAGQLQVHFQPVINLLHGDIVKAEALLRWQHPELGTVEPSIFIPIAEEAGLIGKIGDWVFQQAAACSKRWSEQIGMPFQISVNKSPLHFMSHSTEADWYRHISDLGLSGHHISVEITEGLLLHASGNVFEQLIKYRNAGVQVAIDDFGTGYSSMAYLQKFHIDYLKIDQSFVRDIATNSAHRTIAETIIVMAHKLGLKVIAEGIETQEQLDILYAAKSDYGQGYYFSHPLPEVEFEKLLLKSRFSSI